MTDILRSPRRKALYQIFVRAVDRGFPAPTDTQIAAELRLPTGSITSLVRSLVRLGVIDIDKTHRGRRIVTIAATGLRSTVPTEKGRTARTTRDRTNGTERGLQEIAWAQAEARKRVMQERRAEILGLNRRRWNAGYMTIGSARDCQYPVGESPPYRFCGDRALTGSSYCRGHDDLCHREHVPRSRRFPRTPAILLNL